MRNKINASVEEHKIQVLEKMKLHVHECACTVIDVDQYIDDRGFYKYEHAEEDMAYLIEYYQAQMYRYIIRDLTDTISE